MDAEWLRSQRDPFLSQREKRWSMNSQRLEEIVAELMKPISSDGRRSFDTDLSALLEEYLTEAGLHALDAEDDTEPGAEAGCDTNVAPNFAEIALLLQQSANIYGRKVDFLYKHVLACSDSLLASTQELANASLVSEEPQTPSGRGRKRKASQSALAEFAEISLEPWAGAARGAEAPRPPPTLARMYLELEPRAAGPQDLPLYDYDAENIGLLSDFQVTWRLQEGLLVDELQGGAGGAGGAGDALRPISLLELQAAIEAAAPPPPSPPSPARDSPPATPPPGAPPLAASTPLPAADPAPNPAPDPVPTPAPDPAPTPTPALDAHLVKKERKRRSADKVDDIFNGSLKIVFNEELMRKLRRAREFSVDRRWISGVVQRRKLDILAQRRRLRPEPDDPGDPGDPSGPSGPAAGFPGWSSAQASADADAATATAVAARTDDSDSESGFFEQSGAAGAGEPADADASLSVGAREAAAWKASILRRAAAAEERGTFDVHALGAAVLSALHRHKDVPFPQLLRRQARHGTDVARLTLASLFLANAGNVQISRGPPLSLNSFSLRLLSDDMGRLQLSAHDDEPQR